MGCRARSTSANFDFSQFRLRPISTSANFDFGQFLDVEFLHHKRVGPRRVGGLGLQGDWKNHHSLKIFAFLHGLMTWLVMQRSVWNDIVSWQTRRRNNSTKYPLHASMTTTSKRKKQNLLENCHKYMLSNCSEMFTFGKNWTT